MTVSAILAGFDARSWAGLSLFTRNGTSTPAPATATLHDGGHYPDALGLLNGISSYSTLTTLVDADWTGAGTMTAAISTAGYFTLATSGATSFTVTPGSEDPWGWGGVVASVASGAGELATATRPWTRGPFSATTNAQFVVTRAGPVSVTMPSSQLKVHTLPTWLTGPTAGDIDAVVETLEKWDNAANASTLYKWGIDEEGRTFTSWPTSIGAAKTVSWVSATFKRALGYTGSESAVLSGGIYTLTSTYPALGVLILRNRLAAIDLAADASGSAVETIGGRVVGRLHRYVRDIEIRTALRGGVGLDDSAAAYGDEVEIYLRRVAPYLWRGARCNVYPEWGDPRMGRSMVAQMTDAVSTPVLNSAQVRADAGAVMGRKLCEVSSDSSGRSLLTFPPNRPRIRSSDLSITLRHISDV
jgi:hypothetical protein